jgi:hypothetical protein
MALPSSVTTCQFYRANVNNAILRAAILAVIKDENTHHCGQATRRAERSRDQIDKEFFDARKHW